MGIPLENIVPSSIEDTVNRAVNGAVEFTAQKLRCADAGRAVERLCEGDEWALGYFAYACARNLAAEVAALDRNIGEAYALGLGGDDAEPVSLPVVLVLVAARRTAALESVLGRVAAALPACLAKGAGIPGEKAAGFMDVQVIEEEDINAKKGLGAAVRSVWAPALRVWRRG